MPIFEEYAVREATKEDVPMINDLLEKHFHPEETILKCLLSNSKSTLTETDLKQIDEDQRRSIEAIVMNYICLVLVHRPTNEIVGVNAMMASENPNLSIENRSIDTQKAYPPESKLVQDYFNCMNDILDSCEIFVKFPKVKRALEFYDIAVHKQHRQKGLSKILMKEGIKYAKSHGVDMVFGLFTSPFSKMGAEKIGMKKVLDIDLLKYRDSDGTLLLQDSAPHNIASVMAILIDA